jgi:hypothetical protein
LSRQQLNAANISKAEVIRNQLKITKLFKAQGIRDGARNKYKGRI